MSYKSIGEEKIDQFTPILFMKEFNQTKFLSYLYWSPISKVGSSEKISVWKRNINSQDFILKENEILAVDTEIDITPLRDWGVWVKYFSFSGNQLK